MDINIEKGANKKCKIEEFQSSWLNENVFKGWLAPYQEKAICNVCNIIIKCCKTDLIKHSQTIIHIENVNFKKAFDNTKNLINLSDKEAIDNVDGTNNLIELSHEDKVKRAEIKLAAFFAEHDIAFCTVDHLIPLLKDICIDSKIVQDFALGQVKCTNIIKDIIPKREVEDIIDNLQSCRFSILMNESTDNSDTKIICILVRYVSPLNKKVVIQLLNLISLDVKEYSGSKLFEVFKNLLERKRIPIKNIVGIAYDNFTESVIIGSNSFMQYLKQEVSGLVTLNCICHSFTLIAKKACEKLPLSCENLIRNISTYTSDSAKKCTLLRKFQEFFNVKKKKLQSLNITWLVSQKYVNEILENWDVLKNYFSLAIVEDKLITAEIILSQLNDNTIKAYFLFLKYVLNFFNNFNTLFQSKKILVHKLFENSQQLICQLAQNFVTSHALKYINDLDMNNEQNILNLENIYVGPECENLLESLPLEYRQQIKLTCLDFYKTAIQEMLKRLPHKDPLFEHLTFLEPEIALYDKDRIKFRDLTYIGMTIEHIDITKLAFEWRILPSIFDEQQKKELASLELDEMWRKIVEYKNFNEEKIFPNLELLVEVVLSFPHSNAEAEQIFSILQI